MPAMIFYPGIELLHDDVTQIGLIRGAMKLLVEAKFAQYFSCVDDQEPTVYTWQHGHMMVGTPDIDKEVKLLLLREK